MPRGETTKKCIGQGIRGVGSSFAGCKNSHLPAPILISVCPVHTGAIPASIADFAKKMQFRSHLEEADSLHHEMLMQSDIEICECNSMLGQNSSIEGFATQLLIAFVEMPGTLTHGLFHLVASIPKGISHLHSLRHQASRFPSFCSKLGELLRRILDH